MKSNEEKIKAFLNDEKKMKALLNDEEFINKVSNEEATAETYKEEFKKLDIEFSDDEANRIKDIISKIFKTSAEELTDEFLKDVSGGFTKYDTNNKYDAPDIKKPMTSSAPSGTPSSGVNFDAVFGIGAAAVGIAWATSIVGFAIASAAYRQKAEHERDKDWNSNKDASRKYKKYSAMSDKLTNVLTRIATFGLHGNVNFD